MELAVYPHFPIFLTTNFAGIKIDKKKTKRRIWLLKFLTFQTEIFGRKLLWVRPEESESFFGGKQKTVNNNP